jgi:hypothetical protein
MILNNTTSQGQNDVEIESGGEGEEDVSSLVSGEGSGIKKKKNYFMMNKIKEMLVAPLHIL